MRNDAYDGTIDSLDTIEDVSAVDDGTSHESDIPEVDLMENLQPEPETVLDAMGLEDAFMAGATFPGSEKSRVEMSLDPPDHENAMDALEQEADVLKYLGLSDETIETVRGQLDLILDRKAILEQKKTVVELMNPGLAQRLAKGIEVISRQHSVLTYHLYAMLVARMQADSATAVVEISEIISEGVREIQRGLNGTAMKEEMRLLTAKTKRADMELECISDIFHSLETMQTFTSNSKVGPAKADEKDTNIDG